MEIWKRTALDSIQKKKLSITIDTQSFKFGLLALIWLSSFADEGLLGRMFLDKGSWTCDGQFPCLTAPST